MGWRFRFKPELSENNKQKTHMRHNAILTALLLASTPVWAQTVSSSFTNITVTAIPDGNPVGLTEQLNVGGVGGTVTNVTVQLDITGGFNGDMYAYLVDPAGQMVVLFNRLGVDGSNPFGYSDAGFNITLSGTATNDVHYYQANTYSISGGQLTGTYAADGRNIDPQSAGSVFGSTPPTAGLNLYSGLNGNDLNGTWTLFIADLAAGGGSPTINSVILSIMTVPEPETIWVALLGGAMFWLAIRKKIPM
jgi:subtilisin-like proprotein convertase family protein